MKKLVGFGVVLWLLLILSTTTACASTTKLVERFNTASSEGERVEALAGLCKKGDAASYIAFYQLLSETPREDLGCFGKIFRDGKNIETLIHVGDYLEYIVRPYHEEVEELRRSGKSKEEIEVIVTPKMKEVLSRVELGLGRAVHILQGDIAVGARSQKARLAGFLKENFVSSHKPDTALEGARIGLLSLREEGFEALLREIRTKDDGTIVFALVPKFGEYAVIPTLKMIEDPASTEIQREAGKLFIYKFSMTDAAVIDKLIEAEKHGRYFPTPAKTLENISQAIESLDTFWWTHTRGRFEENPQLVEYIGEKHLPKPNNQDVVIRLMTDMDFSEAVKYFVALDMKAISKDSLHALVRALYSSPSYEKKKRREIDRYHLTAHILAGASVEDRKRESLVLRIQELSPEHQELLIASFFPEMTKKEKESTIFGVKKLSPVIRDRIYGKIQAYCDEDLRQDIEYCKKKDSHSTY